MSTIKHYLCCCFLLLIAFNHLSAQQTTAQKDSATIRQLTDSLKKQNALIKKLSAEVDSLTTKKPVECTDCTKATLKPAQHFLVFTPLVLLLLVAIIFIIWIRNSNFTLEDALSVAPTATQFEEAAKARAAAAQAANAAGVAPPAVPDPKPQGSVSRLLAFITGVVAIIIAVCLVSYNAYAMFAGCGGEKQFEALWKILLGLGIGVIPYGINVWNGNAKEQPTTKS